MEELCSKIALLCQGKDLRKCGEHLEMLLASFEASEEYLGEVSLEHKQELLETVELGKAFIELLTDERQIKTLSQFPRLPAKMGVVG